MSIVKDAILFGRVVLLWIARLLSPLGVMLVLATPAYAWTTHDKLNEVASIFAMRPVEAKCYEIDEAEAPIIYGAWGYVEIPLAKQKYMHLDPEVCEGALQVNNPALPPEQRAIGVAVLIHEAYHLRRWGGAGDEGKVECKAIRHFKVGARLLGATETTVTQLWPYALKDYQRLIQYRDWYGNRPYFDPTCKLPP